MTPRDRFSVCGYTTITASFEEDIAACQSTGVGGLGVCEAKLPAGIADSVLAEKLRAADVQASVCLPATLSILSLPHFPGPEDPDVRLEQIIAGIRRLANFKPACCFCLTGAQGSLEAGRAREIVVAGLRKAARAAADVGVRLGVEPIHASIRKDWTLIATIPEAVELIDDVDDPNLGIGFDTWHLGDTPDLKQHIQRHVRRIVGVHLSDRRDPTRGWADRVLPGQGILDLRGMVDTLERNGFKGWYDLEVLSDNGMFGADYPDSLWRLPAAELARLGREAFLRIAGR